MFTKLFVLNITFLVIVLKSLDVNGNNQNVGDSCTVKKTGAAGECKLFKNCQEATDDLRFKSQLPTSCGYLNKQQIVCCPNIIIQKPSQINITQAHKNLLRYKKCVEYSRAVYEITLGIPLIVGANPIQNKNDRCGHTAVPLIVGGSPASSREFPHSAVLGYNTLGGNNIWLCGGSLVSRRYVLTAGHCLYAKGFGAVRRARMGDLNLLTSTDDAKPEEFDIERTIPHPQYTIASKYNDIALLKLNRLVNFNPYIRPICLPFSAEQPEKAIASGWGALESLGNFSNSLLKVTLEIYQQPECNQSFVNDIGRPLNRGIVGDTQICAGSRNESKDTCQGDSGGPLQIYHPDVYCMYIQTGVTSFGRGCGFVNTPGVYTRLFYYSDWIESVIWPNGDDE